MEDNKIKVESCLAGSFVAGFGVSSDSLFIDFAKGRETYRIWIDTDWELKDFQIKGELNQEQNELLMLNELNNQTVVALKIDSENNILITLTDSEVLLSGKPKDKNIIEPWRIIQVAPENQTMLIHSV